uniref:SANTA domain-containing protein n=1 Tax=Angiostrongylus cantonensis TaxID=6313 RepID=A0A0K0D3E9_ANGCA
MDEQVVTSSFEKSVLDIAVIWKWRRRPPVSHFYVGAVMHSALTDRRCVIGIPSTKLSEVFYYTNFLGEIKKFNEWMNELPLFLEITRRMKKCSLSDAVSPQKQNSLTSSFPLSNAEFLAEGSPTKVPAEVERRMIPITDKEYFQHDDTVATDSVDEISSGRTKCANNENLQLTDDPLVEGLEKVEDSEVGDRFKNKSTVQQTKAEKSQKSVEFRKKNRLSNITAKMQQSDMEVVSRALMNRDENIVKTSGILPTEENFQQKENETLQRGWFDLNTTKNLPVIHGETTTISKLTGATTKEVEPINCLVKRSPVEESFSKTKCLMNAGEEGNGESTRIKRDISLTRESVTTQALEEAKTSTIDPKFYAKSSAMSVFVSKNECETTDTASTVRNFEPINFEERSSNLSAVKCSKQDHVLYVNRHSSCDVQGSTEKTKTTKLLSRRKPELIRKKMEDTVNERANYEERSLKTKLVKPDED